jgi:YHS domain-containing protein
MVAIGWIIRLLVLAIVVRIIVRAVMGRNLRGQPTRRRVERTGGTLARDPQCGTYIPRGAAVTAKAGSATLYFCSAACRDAHIAAQARAV